MLCDVCMCGRVDFFIAKICYDIAGLDINYGISNTVVLEIP